MSKSRKKVPIIGMTTAASDKRFKKLEHSRERSTVKVALSEGRDPPSPRLFGDPASGEKDGKQYAPDYDKALRK